jgi:hypothetical protein
MKTLVIHPDDRSTDFLKPIYESVDNKTVITGGKSREEIIDLIQSHDRVLMMGHGSPGGLFKTGTFSDYLSLYLIDKDLVPYLKDKENFYIWCYADEFVRAHNLRGFFSGMFVSEPGEAVACDLVNRRKLLDMDLLNKVEESNEEFSRIVGENMHLPLDEMFKEVREQYHSVAKSNKIASYNHDRLYKVG